MVLSQRAASLRGQTRAGDAQAGLEDGQCEGTHGGRGPRPPKQRSWGCGMAPATGEAGEKWGRKGASS